MRNDTGASAMLVSQGRSRSTLSRRRWARRSRNPMGAESGSAPWGARPECSAARELGRHARPVTGSSGLPPDAMGHPGIGGDLAGHVSCCGFHCASGDSGPGGRPRRAPVLAGRVLAPRGQRHADAGRRVWPVRAGRRAPRLSQPSRALLGPHSREAGQPIREPRSATGLAEVA